jgi:hypothetical protein
MSVVDAAAALAKRKALMGVGGLSLAELSVELGVLGLPVGRCPSLRLAAHLFT